MPPTAASRSAPVTSARRLGSAPRMCGSYDAGAPAAGAEQGGVDARVADYLQSLELERAASRNTVAAYRRDLRELEAWLAARGLDPDALAGDDLVPYANRSEERRGGEEWRTWVSP